MPEPRSVQIGALPPLATISALVRSDITAGLVRDVKRLWMAPGVMQPHVWMLRHGDEFYKTLTLAQVEVATVATATVDPLLESQGYAGDQDTHVSTTALAGVDGTGRDALGLAFAASLPLAAAHDAGAPPELTYALWTAAARVLQLAAHTALLDTSRVAKSVELAGRPRTGWVRMVRPPCCSRCAILAGRIYPRGGSFQRHPNCDCDSVPVADFENRLNDPSLQGWVFDTDDYFRSLSEKEQAKVFTAAGARAIRNGADPIQIVNARRGMSTAKDRFGTSRKVSYESTTSRGWASRYLRSQYGATLQKRGGRYRQTSRPRLMPEEIYEMAGDDHNKALTLLHNNGYLEGTTPGLNGTGVRDAEVTAAKQRALRRLEKRGAGTAVLQRRQRVIHRTTNPTHLT